jgi:glyoxylase-like metal-dependent hydrolase (beta-lactamase superfamily II)
MKFYKIETGFFSSDGGAIFGTTPKMLWKNFYPADESNFCGMAMRSLLVHLKDKLILIDTGVGNKHPDIMNDYGFRDIVHFEKELQKIGFFCSDVTDVILTHLHFDHCGGCTWIDRKMELQLTFPNAVHWASEAQWKNMLNPNLREENAYFTADMMPVFKQDKLRLITENERICKEIELRLFSGHTEGQIVPYLFERNRTFVFLGDVIPTAANIPLDWLSAYDVNQIEAIEGKQRLLEEAVEEKQILIFEHDVYTECATVRKRRDFEIEEMMKVGDL